MSRLAELIAEFCPDGVEYKSLYEVTTITRGVRVVRKQLTEEGKYPVYQNSLLPMGYYDEWNCPANTVFIISAGAAGEIGYSTVDFWAADDCFWFECSETLLNRYLYHMLLKQQPYIFSQVRKASIPRLPRLVIESLKIPVPPLPVQCEIVRILDNFTELTAELTAELEAELTARKKQYEFYRDQLLSFSVRGGGHVRLNGGRLEKSLPSHMDIPLRRRTQEIQDLSGLRMLMKKAAYVLLMLSLLILQKKAKNIF